MKKIFIHETNFIGVLLPDNLQDSLMEQRNYMKMRYGCKSGFATPFHVTLLPPFVLPQEFSTNEIVFALENALKTFQSFTAELKGFDAFGDRTIFADVKFDKKWICLKDAVTKAVHLSFPGCSKKTERAFKPHVTIANRDIPQGETTAVLSVFGELHFAATFSVDNVCVFTSENGKWQAFEKNIIAL